MAKILVADDEQLIRKLISDCLTKEGHQVLEAEDGLEGLSIFRSNKDINLCILDIMMPEIDGWELCRKIRETSGVPIMLVSARSQDFDQIMGFESGADDYVTKPFSLAILSKRVKTLLQRGAVQSPTNPEATKIIVIDDLTFDEGSYEVRYNGRQIDFTAKEFEIIKIFIKNPGRVYSRENIVKLIWDEDFDGMARTVDSHIARIRTKLGDWGAKHLVTVYGAGYKLDDK